MPAQHAQQQWLHPQFLLWPHQPTNPCWRVLQTPADQVVARLVQRAIHRRGHLRATPRTVVGRCLRRPTRVWWWLCPSTRHCPTRPSPHTPRGRDRADLARCRLRPLGHATTATPRWHWHRANLLQSPRRATTRGPLLRAGRAAHRDHGPKRPLPNQPASIAQRVKWRWW